MGDVIMSTPAFRALKETFDCRLTLLTSKMGSIIAPHIKEIDETIVFDFPWVKTNNAIGSEECLQLIEKLKSYYFDGAIIFTVYSQNPLPSALITCLANIPLRLAYCRENPYALLTDWVPDKEPYSFIRHQVKRDLNLVKTIGASTTDEHLCVQFNESAFRTAIEKLSAIGFNTDDKWIIAHAGVSEKKREYPEAYWIEALQLIQQDSDIQVLLTGSKEEQPLTQRIKNAVGENVFLVAGILNVEEMIAVTAYAQLVISVNTATLHIAAAVQTPVIALYAQTNPQHTPWKVKNTVLPYSIPDSLKSKNEIIQYVDAHHFNMNIDYPAPVIIALHAKNIMENKTPHPAKNFIVSA